MLLDGDRAVLLRNDREEWELPGGRLEPDESPEECLERETREELNLRVDVGPLLDARVYEPLPRTRVLVLTYGCTTTGFAGMAHSAEHEDVGLFRADELDRIELPRGYARSVRLWLERRASARGTGIG